MSAARKVFTKSDLKSFDTSWSGCCFSTFLPAVGGFIADLCLALALCLSTSWRLSQDTLTLQRLQNSWSSPVTQNSSSNSRSYSLAFDCFLSRIGGMVVQVYSTTACAQALKYSLYKCITDYGNCITFNQFVCAERNLVTSHYYITTKQRAPVIHFQRLNSSLEARKGQKWTKIHQIFTNVSKST